MKARTIKSEKVWEAPDGSRTIWAVTMEAEGKEYKLQTFSQKIAEVGYQGDVETYVNNRGDRFVKQTPQAGGGRGGYQPKDEAAIRAMWSIGQAAQAAPLTPADDGYYDAVEDIAKHLYQMIDRVKGAGGGES